MVLSWLLLLESMNFASEGILCEATTNFLTITSHHKRNVAIIVGPIVQIEQHFRVRYILRPGRYQI